MYRASLSPRSPCFSLRRSLTATFTVLILGSLGGVYSPVTAQEARPAGGEERIRAPELDGVGWLGTDKAIRLKDLRGKIVILDFWTLC